MNAILPSNVFGAVSPYPTVVTIVPQKYAAPENVFTRITNIRFNPQATIEPHEAN